jgi:hypothetical protein
LREQLFEHSNYAPIHRPIQGAVLEEAGNSCKPASEITTLLCSQRHKKADMDRLVGER